MRFSSFFCVCAASLATLGAAQAVLPTAHARTGDAASAADYQVSIQSLHARHTPRGLEVTGRIVNTGRQTLTHTSLVLVFAHAAGPDTRENAYLTSGPVCPGENAEFRAALPEPPAFIRIFLTLCEAGQPVAVTGDSQKPDKRLTTALWSNCAKNSARSPQP